MAHDFLALLGPTASGKTALSLAVAERIGAEIVSLDSRQVYRGMDVGTAKVEAAARARVPHHGLDLVDPDESYSAGRFAREARRWIAGIRGRGRVPLLVGGTGFFLRALTEPIFREPPLERRRVAALRAWARRQPVERLARWVEELDPDRATVAAQGGRQRLARTLEVALLSGRPLSLWHRSAEPDGNPLAGPTVVLELPREEMDRRIDARVDAMLAAGLVEEVNALLSAGYSPSDPGMTATGYREIVRYLQGDWALERAREEMRRSTRRYARRQLTWFRNQIGPGVVRVDAAAPVEEQVDRVVAAWQVGPNQRRGGA
jgi:tRNA dimethylallyltransferase